MWWYNGHPAGADENIDLSTVRRCQLSTLSYLSHFDIIIVPKMFPHMSNRVIEECVLTALLDAYE